MIYFIVSIYI